MGQGTIGPAPLFPRQLAAATADVVIGCAAAHAQTFSRVVTEPGLGRFDYVVAAVPRPLSCRSELIVCQPVGDMRLPLW